jgi:hypothetical protein
MISNHTKQELLKAIGNPELYGSGTMRKQLQATYDKMLDEISIYIFQKHLDSRMALRQELVKSARSLSKKPRWLDPLLEVMRNESMLFSKDYREHSKDIEKFLTNYVSLFIRCF